MLRKLKSTCGNFHIWSAGNCGGLGTETVRPILALPKIEKFIFKTAQAHVTKHKRPPFIFHKAWVFHTRLSWCWEGKRLKQMYCWVWLLAWINLEKTFTVFLKKPWKAIIFFLYSACEYHWFFSRNQTKTLLTKLLAIFPFRVLLMFP